MRLLDFWDWIDVHDEPIEVSVASIFFLIVISIAVVIAGFAYSSHSWKKEALELRKLQKEFQEFEKTKHELKISNETIEELRNDIKELAIKNELLHDTNEKLTSILKAQSNDKQNPD